MANIDIERKGGIPWWVWLLGVLLLGALIWWAIGRGTENRTAEIAPITDTTVTDDTAVTDNTADNTAVTDNTAATADGAPITDILAIVDAETPASLVGRRVTLAGAPVQAAGDGKVFWIGPSFEQKMLVVTDAGTDMGGAVDGVAHAQRLNITGEIREIADFADAKKKYNLDDDAVTFLTNKKIYLHADQVTIDKK